MKFIHIFGYMANKDNCNLITLWEQEQLSLFEAMDEVVNIDAADIVASFPSSNCNSLTIKISIELPSFVSTFEEIGHI